LGKFRITLGLNEVATVRSNLEKYELSNFPFIPCHTPRRLKGREHSMSSKNIFRYHLFDRLSSFLINLIFPFLKIKEWLKMNSIFKIHQFK